jgi:hypothetical protein
VSWEEELLLLLLLQVVVADVGRASVSIIID